MSDVREAARAEVERRHPAWHDNGVGVVQGAHYRNGFVDGAAWQALRAGLTPEALEEVLLAGRAVWDQRITDQVTSTPHEHADAITTTVLMVALRHMREQS